jgi:glucokinase
MQGREGVRSVSAADVVGALDIGGTHVSAGRIDLLSATVDPATRVRVPLPRAGGREQLVAAILRAARSIAAPDVRRLAVAVPGPFDYSAGVSRIDHKLEGLRGVDLRSELCAALGLPDPSAAHFLNDADAFVLGEWWAGAARGHARAVGITLGTGLGSGFVEDGRLVHAGPRVPDGGDLYRLRFRGAPVEQTISRGALLARYGEDGIDVEEIATRARAGERDARRVFEELGESLAEFLTPWGQRFEPTCLVVGGAIARSWNLLETRLRTGLESVEGLRTVAAAEQMDDAPLLGAARFASSDCS